MKAGPWNINHEIQTPVSFSVTGFSFPRWALPVCLPGFLSALDGLPPCPSPHRNPSLHTPVLPSQGPGPCLPTGCATQSRCPLIERLQGTQETQCQRSARLGSLRSRESGHCRGAGQGAGSCIWSRVEAEGRMAFVADESFSG